MSLSAFAELIAPVKVFEKNLVSKDRKATILTLLLSAEASHEKVIEGVGSMIENAGEGLKLYQIGMPLVSEALAEYTALDLRRLPPITLAVIACILLLLFRHASCVLLPVAVVVLAQVWTFGLMGWMQIPLSMLTMIVPVFLIAVGTAYCLYMCSEYAEWAAESKTAREAVQSAVGNMAFPTILAVSTTVAGIGSLAVNPIVAIREFALFACFGMASLLVLLLTFFPAVLSTLPPPRRRSTGGGIPDRVLNGVLEKIVDLNLRRQKPCITLLAVILIFLSIGALRIRVETNPVEYFKKDTAVSRHFHDIYRDLSGSFPVHVVGQGETSYFFEDLDRLRSLERFQADLETLPGVDKAVSFLDYLKLVNFAMNRYDPKFYALPEESFELSMLVNNFKIILGDDMLARFMSPDFSRTNILLLTHISSSSALLSTRERILEKASAFLGDGVSWDTTGFGVVMAASSHQLVTGQVKSLSLALVLIFLIMMGLFLSSKVGLIAVLPNLVPIITNFGVMGWLGIPLSVATSLIASVAIGLAVDDTLHYMFRYNNEFKKDLDKDRALRDTIRGVGKPIIFTTVTISGGFLILLFSQFQPTALFGLLLVITLLAALVGDLILLPSLMLHMELITAWDLLQRMPTVGGIPPATAHELRQPLNAIKVGNDFLKMMLRQGREITEEQLSRVVTETSLQVDRASTTINRLMEFGQQPESPARPVDVNDTVQEVVQFVRNEMKLDNIEMITQYADDLPPVRGHARRLRQVVFNALSNAREAIAARPAEGGETAKRQVSICTQSGRGRVLIVIADSGVGIPKHLVNRVFEPFFSTRGPGKGLGLAISRQIVKGYGGRLSIRSREGSGTTLTIDLPQDGR
jgi:predicted RND superfamily exporter protein